MVNLVPAPASLGLASPALGPWFNVADQSPGTTPPLPVLGAPAANLSVALSLPAAMEWRAPANCLLSYVVATDPRPPAVEGLRQENGSPAFASGDLVILLTLLPEVELRLQALSAVIPSPDGNPVTNGTPTRPRVRYLAVAIPAASVSSIGTLEQLRENDFPIEVASDEDKAAYLGLSFAGGRLGNAKSPTTELRRPARDSAIVLKNRTGSSLGVSLWAFDYRGRPLDPGAVASWWSHLASPGVFDNLWAHTDTALQRTASVTGGNTLHLASVNEGPLSAPLLARLGRTGLTQTAGSTALFSVANPASLNLTTAPNPDDAPVPRIALLPHRNFADPHTAGSGLFNGWHSTATPWPTTLNRDFVRVAMVDIESHLVGLSRASANQALARTRISGLRNTAAAPFLTQSDAGHQQVLNQLAGAGAQLMSPVLDSHWGALTVGSFGTGALPGSLVYSIKALAGEGATTGGTASGQRIAIHFPPGALPAGGWIRCWPHGLDTATGLRFRQDGGGALADTNGQAFVVMAIPDGTAAPTALNAAPVRLSFDALIVTDNDARYYVEQRYDRPAVLDGSALALPAPPDIPPATSLWICEQGRAMTRAGAQYGSGQTLLGVPADVDAGTFALVELATLDDSDISAATLRRATSAGDILIVTQPAFATTDEGDVTSTPGPNGATVVARQRNALTDVGVFGGPVPLMERREMAAVDAAAVTGIVAATPGRARNHEAVPAQFGHAGVPAAAEIHGASAVLAGPAVAPLSSLMTERAAATLGDFIAAAQQPVTPIPDRGGTSAFIALLETLTFGVAGDAAIRTLIGTGATFTPGQDWVDIKNAFESATGQDLDPLIDTATFDEDALAAAFDRIILKTRDGARETATALQAAIGRAEDFVYIETPAIDPLTAGASDAVDLIGAIKARWLERPHLKVLLCVPEKFLPGQPEKLDTIRKAGIAAALKSLREANAENVELFTPVAGSGRRLHMASTTVIIDDVIAITGTTHLWRRGLTFDSSLAVALFDENVSDGRSTAVRNARRQLFIDRLGLATGLAPDDAGDMLDAVRRLNATGGLQRVTTDAYAAAEDVTSETDRNIWNPDGRPGGVSDWFLFFAGLDASELDEINNAIR